MSTEQRIIDLEVRLAYQEDSLNALDQVVARQAEQITQLTEMNRELYRRLQDLLDQLDQGPSDERPPPHY